MTGARLVVRLDAALPALVRARLAAFADGDVAVIDDDARAASVRTVAPVPAAPGDPAVVVRAWAGAARGDAPTVWLVDGAQSLATLPIARTPSAAWLPLDAEPWRVLAAARAVRDGLTVLGAGAVRDTTGRDATGRDGAARTGGPRVRRPLRAIAPEERTPGDLAEGTPLTEREREVLRALAEGLGNKQVAARLGIGASTVKSHLEAIYAKLGAHTRSEAVARAMRAGLVPL